jgi:hypothetical protein
MQVIRLPIPKNLGCGQAAESKFELYVPLTSAPRTCHLCIKIDRLNTAHYLHNADGYQLQVVYMCWREYFVQHPPH